MFICATINTKGGVGKTATVVHAGAALAKKGYRVLLMDMDLRAGVTKHFQLKKQVEDGAPTSSEVLVGGIGLDEACIQVRDNLFVVPASGALEATETQLSRAGGGERRLRRIVTHFRQVKPGYFDLVFLDCASGWNTISRNAIVASDGLLVPVNSESPAIVDAVETVSLATELADYNDCSVPLLGVLLNESRATNSAQTVARLAAGAWGEAVFQSRIRKAELINELAITHQTLSDLSRSAAGDVGQDYANFACEFVQRARLGKPKSGKPTQSKPGKAKVKG
jgi:chromosome partitioning protein